MVGNTISHYRILEKLGEGGMGVVYKAEDTKLRRTVALKFLPPALLVGEDEKKRFVHEAQASASLSHPNIATVYEIDETGPEAFIALEYITGQTLAERMKSGPMKLEEAVSLTVQIAEALQAAHEAGIVHRDIKCQNIMVTTKGQAKILDFGLAKLRGASVVTRAGTTLGTMGYMSPEQLRGETVDQRSDLWALGVVLYEMIAGRRPFHGDYEEAVAYQVLNGQQDPLTSVRTGVPMELERIVNKLLQKVSSARYQSATDLLVDLRSLSLLPGSNENRPVSAVSTPGTLPPRVRKILIGVATVLVIGIAGSYHLLFRANASPIRSLAVLPFENLSKDPEQEYFADEMTDQLITELSKVHSLRVISRKSAMVFKGRHELLPSIGRTLNVEGLITATVLRSGDRVRVNAQLIRASDEENLWSESFDRKVEGVLEIQSALARSISQRVSITLTPAEQFRLSESRVVNPEAFDLVARGNYLLNNAADEASFLKVYDLMQRAVAIDSTYAEALVGLALAAVHQQFFGFKVSSARLEEAQRALDKALDIDPSSARAYSARGQLFWIEGNLPECIRANNRAVELNPRDGFSLTNYSWMLMLQGRQDEGISQAQKAVELDPLSQYARCNLAGWYYSAHRWRESEAEAHRILELDSTWEPALSQLALICEHEGRYAEAQEWWIKDFRRRGMDTGSLPRAGSWDEFRAWRLKMLEKGGYLSDLVYALIPEGEKDRALAILKKCVDARQPITLALFYPDFDPLRGDPRFEQLVSDAQLPVEAYCTVSSRH
jgi:serine/threonine protein kinase/Tfp pilus assembly protein PilF